jgi:hypothetical protein
MIYTVDLYLLGDRVYTQRMPPPAEHSESEILLVAMELLVQLVAFLDSEYPTALDEFEGVLF